MAKATRGSKRREDALPRERIVDAAIDLLDDDGENGVTFSRSEGDRRSSVDAFR